jgi:hypothetical protein
MQSPRFIRLLTMLLFVGTITTVTGVVVSTSLLSVQVGMRSEIIADVEHAGMFATELISQKTRAAEFVDAKDNALKLVVDGKETIITLENEKIKMVEDGKVSYLTPDSVSVEDLDFVLLGESKTSKNGVTVQFNVVNRSEGENVVEDYSQTFHATVAGR